MGEGFHFEQGKLIEHVVFGALLEKQAFLADKMGYTPWSTLPQGFYGFLKDYLDGYWFKRPEETSLEHFLKGEQCVL